MFVLLSCHALVHDYVQRFLVGLYLSSLLGLVHPRAFGVFSDEMSWKAYLFECNLTAVLDMRQIFIKVSFPCLVIYLFIEVG